MNKLVGWSFGFKLHLIINHNGSKEHEEKIHIAVGQGHVKKAIYY